MSELDLLETRLTAALDRIKSGLDARANAGIDPAVLLDRDGRIATLEAELAQARTAPAGDLDRLSEMEEQVATLRSQLADAGDGGAQIAALEAKLAAQAKELKAAQAAVIERDDRIAEMASHDSADADEPKVDIAALQAELDKERAANAELGKRVDALGKNVASQTGASKRREDQRKAQMDDLDQKLQRLQQVNADLRDINGQLRVALADGTADAELINRAMEAELDALRASRAAEAAEVATIVAELKPIVEEAL